MKKIVIVTGSNGRFGKYISRKLIDNKNIIPILVTSKKIKKKYYYQLNIKKVQSIKKFLFFIKKKYGEPDILINNAAVNTTRNFNDFINNSIDEKIIETYTVNSISSLFFIKFFLKSIEKNKKKEKKVINMLTRHAIWGNKRHVDYYSSKASLYNATRSLARDYPFFTFVNGGGLISTTFPGKFLSEYGNVIAVCLSSLFSRISSAFFFNSPLQSGRKTSSPVPTYKGIKKPSRRKRLMTDKRSKAIIYLNILIILPTWTAYL